MVSLLVAFWLWIGPILINNLNHALHGNLPRSGWVQTSKGKIEIIADHKKWEVVLYKGRPVFKDE